jgi:hypothetical protein
MCFPAVGCEKGIFAGEFLIGTFQTKIVCEVAGNFKYTCCKFAGRIDKGLVVIMVVINQQVEADCFEQKKQKKQVIPYDEPDKVSHGAETVGLFQMNPNSLRLFGIVFI